MHGDCHPGNAMVEEGKIFFIDLANSGMGHPIIGLITMYNIYEFQ